MNVFIAILGLAVLILVHEAGHFFTALATGMRPRRFYIGFPPAIARVELAKARATAPTLAPGARPRNERRPRKKRPPVEPVEVVEVAAHA